MASFLSPILNARVTRAYAIAAVCMSAAHAQPVRPTQTDLPEAPAAGGQNFDQAEQILWNAIKDSRDPGVIEEYLEKYPKGRYAGKARVMLTILKAQVRLPETSSMLATPEPGASDEDSESRLWKQAETRGVREDFEVYLKQYPNGRYAPNAEIELGKLDAKEQAARTKEEAERKTQQELAALEKREEARRQEEQRSRIESESQALTLKLDRREAEKSANVRSAGMVFRDCANCPEMVVIPAGSFNMGSAPSETGHDSDEAPRHSVAIPSQFALAKTEIRRGQFAAFVKETGYAAGGGCLAFANGRWGKKAGRSWRNPGYPQLDNHPVVCVNWNDARAYVSWLARKTGKPYRLPSEAEWEYAARAGTKTARYWGGGQNLACSYANIMDTKGKAKVPGVTWAAHKCNDGYAYTSPVGQFKPNTFGLYDMIGNAWEWTEDCWNESYRAAPVDGGAWTAGECGKRVLRGGSWDNEPPFARSAVRYKTEVSTRFNTSGFRVARTLP